MIYDLPPVESDKEVKERKELKILTSNKLLTRLPSGLRHYIKNQKDTGSNSHQVLRQALGSNLAAKLLVTFGSNKNKRQ